MASTISRSDIEKLLLREDWRFLREQLARQPAEARRGVKREYGTRFIEAYDAEPVVHRKTNSARRAANLWLLNHFGPVKDTGPDFEPVKLAMTPMDWAYGKQQLEAVRAAGKTAPDNIFGNLELGFAAERVVDAWLNSLVGEHEWRNEPGDTRPDFRILDKEVDLKTLAAKGIPRAEYSGALSDLQRRNSSGREWYLFARHNNLNETDLFVCGFGTEETITSHGRFYRKGQKTPGSMTAPTDCWIIDYGLLIPPMKWLTLQGWKS